MKQLIKTDDYLAYNDPLLDYLIDVANHFWLSYDPDVIYVDENGKTVYGGFTESLVPEQFANKFFAGNINTDREQKYLASTEVLDTLEAFGLDIDKFWYLCLAIKDFVEGQTDNAIKSKKNPRQELKALEDELNKLEPEFKDGSIKCKGSGVLTLKVGKHPIKVTNPTTLTLINMAIHNCLEEYKDNNGLFDAVGLDVEDIVTLKPIYKIVLFNKYLSWFLKDKVADKAKYASKDKSLLVSRMIFILGISDDEPFFEEYREDGSKLNYLKNYIKKYKNVEISTIQSRYFLQG